MTCFDKQNYKELKRSAKYEGDVFAYALDTPGYSTEYSGVSVAFQPAIENSNGKMLNVAVSYCSSEDKFKPKHGKYQALLKLVNANEYVQLPLAKMLREEGSETVSDYLLGVFTV